MEIDFQEKELLAGEIKALAEAIQGDTRNTYASLLKFIEAGQVPEEFMIYLERLLEIGFETGRIRRVYGREGEQVFLQIYHKTPKGSRILNLVKETNRSLTTLKDQVVQNVSFSLKSPGAYRLIIDTPTCQLTLGIDPDGTRIENTEVGI
jgi:hypothetical protein